MEPKLPLMRTIIRGCGRKKVALKTVNDSFKAEGNRRIRLNKELTSFHREVIENLNSTHGALLRMNRSIQVEGAYGTIKWNMLYIRARRRGLKGMFLEIALISNGFNLHFVKQKIPKFDESSDFGILIWDFFYSSFLILFAHKEAAPFDEREALSHERLCRRPLLRLIVRDEGKPDTKR